MLLALLESIKKGFRRSPGPDVAEGTQTLRRSQVAECGHLLRLRDLLTVGVSRTLVPESAARGFG